MRNSNYGLLGNNTEQFQLIQNGECESYRKSGASVLKLPYKHQIQIFRKNYKGRHKNLINRNIIQENPKFELCFCFRISYKM